jgi:serine phosphatase RsbU (regulator of sigma subunit)
MVLPMAESTHRWYKWPKKWTPFRETPWKRLWLFYLAVFFIFTVIGYFNDLMNMGTISYVGVLVMAAICGIDAVLWALVSSRFPWPFVIPMVGAQFLLGPFLTWMINGLSRQAWVAPVTPENGVRFAAFCILLCTVVSYALFVTFFQVEARESARMRTQLELAHGIQKTLVPTIALQTEMFEVYGISQPSEQVGGDLVDAVLLPNGDVIAYLADIAGHGLSAGILMGMLKTAARTALLDASTGNPGESLPLLLEKLNRVLPDVKEPQMYATLTAFRLNADGRAWYAMAASPPVLHWSPQRRDLRLMQEEQFPLGLLPISGFTGEAIELVPGDVLVVATDGVLEVCNRGDEEFGIERLEQSIAGNVQKPLAEMASAILHGALAFGKQTDDQTLLVIRRS